MAQSDPKLEQLKQKYLPALNLMEQLQVRLSHLHIQDGKLFIQGEAPSQDAKNRVWNQIKLIDPSYSDLTCDLAVNSAVQGQSQQPQGGAQQSPQTMTAGASVSGGSGRRYTVKTGDSLSKISKEFYGSPAEYMKIFQANRNVLSDPNKLEPGQELVIPE